METNLVERIEILESLRLEYEEELAEFFRDAPRLFREARKEKGWSQRKIAELLRVDFTYISKIENGQLKPGMPTIRKLGQLLKGRG